MSVAMMRLVCLCVYRLIEGVIDVHRLTKELLSVED
jgi:hypothetical protein